MLVDDPTVVLAVVPFLLCQCTGPSIKVSDDDLGADRSVSRDSAPADVARGSSADASARDASTADRAGRDARLPVEIHLPPVTCQEGMLFCDDFEGGALDPTRWGISTMTYYFNGPRYVSIDVDSPPFARGRRSVRFRQTRVTGAENGDEARDGFITPKLQFPVGQNRLFVRYFTYIDDPTPKHNFVLSFVLDSAKSPPQDGTHYCNVKLSDIGNGRMAYRTGCGDLEPQNAAVQVPLGRWSCVEYEVRGDRKELVLYIDGQPLSGSSVMAPYAPSDVGLHFGFGDGHEDTSQHPPDGFFDIWIDDVAVSTKRIGCTP